MLEGAAMGDDHRPDPMPVHRKFSLFLKNNAGKMLTAKSCCGHPGEPGC